MQHFYMLIDGKPSETRPRYKWHWKIRQIIVLQYHFTKRGQKLDAFEKRFMQQNILGSLTETGLQTFPLFD